MPDYRLHRWALSAKVHRKLCEAVLASPLAGRSTLNGPFEATRGFGVTFTEAGRPRVTERFPELAPFLKRALGDAAVRELLGWPRRLFERPKGPNAWYLNLLLVGEGAEVKRHVDATLAPLVGKPGTTPLVVSVLYLLAPQARGGELVLSRGSELLHVLRPRARALVHFRGELDHAVAPAHGLPLGQLRASLVLEQYRLEPELLEKLPELRVDSGAGFGAFLLDRAARPPGPPLELD